MIYNSVYKQFFKFHEVWRANVHDIRKNCLEITLCVLVCFVEFYVFLLDEIDVGGPKLVYDHIQVRKVREKVTKDQPRVLEDGPSMEQKVV